MKNQTKKTEEKVYTMGEVGSLLESMDGTMKMMSENYVGLVKTQDKILAVQYDMKNQLERVEIRLSGVEGGLIGVEGRLSGVEGRLSGVEGRLDGVEHRLEKVETKIDRLQDDMVEVKFELKKKVAVDDFEKLEKRVVKLEKLSYSH
jgi:archaellum component FlaC